MLFGLLYASILPIAIAKRRYCRSSKERSGWSIYFLLLSSSAAKVGTTPPAVPSPETLRHRRLRALVALRRQNVDIVRKDMRTQSLSSRLKAVEGPQAWKPPDKLACMVPWAVSDCRNCLCAIQFACASVITVLANCSSYYGSDQWALCLTEASFLVAMPACFVLNERSRLYSILLRIVCYHSDAISHNDLQSKPYAHGTSHCRQTGLHMTRPRVHCGQSIPWTSAGIAGRIIANIVLDSCPLKSIVARTPRF